MFKLFFSTAIALLIFTQSALAVVSPINDGVIKCTNPEEYNYTHQVRWGYRNNTENTINIPIGNTNKFTGTPNANMGQPENFLSGRIVNIFRTPINSGDTIVWTLENKTATASIPLIDKERICLP